MNYKEILHTPFKAAGVLFTSLLESFEYYMQDAYDEMDTIVDNFSVETATGTYLDLYGKDVQLERLTSETDASYRLRIKDAYRGICATTGDLKILVDRVLLYSGFSETCTIYEFFNKNWLDLLTTAEFTVDLPNEVHFGFFLDYSFYNFVEPTTRSFREPFFNSISGILEDMNVDAIRNIVERKKACGTTFKISWKGLLIDEES